MLTGPFHATIVHNTTARTFHPMPFRLAPRPSDDLEPGSYCRHRSIGHHTDGFRSLEEAVAHINEREDFWPTGLIFAWTGEGSPHATLELPCGQKMEGDITWALPETKESA